MPTLETYKGVVLWHYVPNRPAAIIFTILFGLLTIAHIRKMVITRLWFCLPFVVGGIFEVIGYIARAAAYSSTGALGPYMVQALFLVLAPVLFAASVYMVYSRVVRAVKGEMFSLVSPRWTSIIFVAGDCFCLNMQSTGGGLLANSNLTRTGAYIIVAGLGLQVLLFAGFMLCCLRFNVRFRAHLKKTGATCDIPWQATLNMLYATSVFILLRNIYRMVEFIMGQNGYLLSNEWPTYVFDGTLMLPVMAGFYFRYPNQLRPGTRGSITGMELLADRDNSTVQGGAVRTT